MKYILPLIITSCIGDIVNLIVFPTVISENPSSFGGFTLYPLYTYITTTIMDVASSIFILIQIIRKKYSALNILFILQLPIKFTALYYANNISEHPGLNYKETNRVYQLSNGLSLMLCIFLLLFRDKLIKF